MTIPSLGTSGKLASIACKSHLTPLLALVGLLLGIFAILITPREEEPQINVTMANIFIPYEGASAKEVENLITSPMEQILSEISDIDHIYSMSRPGEAILTVQYKVYVPRTEALVRLYNAIYSNQDWQASRLKNIIPLVKPKGIDDVPIITLTLWSRDPNTSALDLRQIAHALEIELKRIPGTRNIYTIGGPEQIAKIAIDPAKLAARNISLNDLTGALQATNSSFYSAGIIENNIYIPLQAGKFISNIQELKDLIIAVHNGKPVYLEEVASIEYAGSENQNYVDYIDNSTAEKNYSVPAVTLAVSKKPGENAVKIANRVINRIKNLEGNFIPEGVEVSVTRNYGATADEKATTLIKKLVFATLSVIFLVLISLSWREATIVGAAVILTLAVTLFASYLWGFTINRVSLFALIFSIGIIVDDAIVIVENIHRHFIIKASSTIETISIAVNEVGSPTILATFTVIAALMPMAFVTGLMGPYMSPIPINASMGMLISLTIALTFTPWLSNKILRKIEIKRKRLDVDHYLHQFFTRIITPFLGSKNKKNRRWLSIVIIMLIIFSMGLVFFKVVILKMLPFDNKSEFQVMVDLPEGSSLEKTSAALHELSQYLVTLPEVTNLQLYAGTASPIGFNGLVRQYYLRQSPHLGDIQVNLKSKHQRKRTSHTIAMDSRKALNNIAARYGATLKIAEVPPGPPVQAPIVAEVYGPDYDKQIEKAKIIKNQFEKIPNIVDIDDSIEANSERFVINVDRKKAALFNIQQAQIASAIHAALHGLDVSFLHTNHAKYPVPIRIELPIAQKSMIKNILDMKVHNNEGKLIPLSEIVTVSKEKWEKTIYHKDLLPVVYVTGEKAGKVDSPLYGMLEIMSGLDPKIKQFYTHQPSDTFDYAIKWDGEWQITYETFRDMGIAYSIALLLIYLLIVGQFQSYLIPLIIMVPIPLTIIGILPGHALFGAPFTATSMIGMIALAGIIVRNSILLVDFIKHALANGENIDNAIINAAAIRAKPIILTALAAMLGGFFILDDPIFNGLAISLIFGILISTLLTLVLIPLLYYVYWQTNNKSENTAPPSS